MANLTIDLQAGFSEDRVRVVIDGVTAVELDSVSTDYSIGRAESATVELEPGMHRIELEIEARQIAASHDLEIAGETYLGVSIGDGGQADFRESDAPFVYF